MTSSEKVYKVGPWLVHKGIDNSKLYSNLRTQKTVSFPPEIVILADELKEKNIPITIHETFDKKIYYHNYNTKKSMWAEPSEVKAVRSEISKRLLHSPLPIKVTKEDLTITTKSNTPSTKEDLELMFKQKQQKDIRNFLACCVDRTPGPEHSFSEALYYLMKDNRFYCIKELNLKRFIYEKFYLYIQNEISKRAE